MILSCIQKRSLTILGRMRMGGGSRRRVLYSSSGVLYNSSSFFSPPLSLTRIAATTSTPRFRGPSPLDSTRLVFQPLSPPSERQHRLGDNGSHQASGINYARLSPREKLRAGPKLELVARRQRRRRKVVSEVFCSMSFLSAEVETKRTAVPGNLAIPTLTFEFL